MIDAELLKIMCCPETHQPIEMADPVLLDQLNARVTEGSLRNRAGQLVTERLEGGLLRQDKKVLYPIWQDIPVMLVDEAIPMGDADPPTSDPR